MKRSSRESNWGRIGIQDSDATGARGANRNSALTPIALVEVAKLFLRQHRQRGQSTISLGATFSVYVPFLNRDLTPLPRVLRVDGAIPAPHPATQCGTGRDRNSPSSIPSPPTIRLRQGLKAAAKAAVPRWAWSAIDNLLNVLSTFTQRPAHDGDFLEGLAPPVNACPANGPAIVSCRARPT